MDAEIIKQNGESFKLSEIGMYVTDFIISSIQMDTYSEVIEGRTGLVDHGAEHRSRTIKVNFVARPYDGHDFSHLRDEIYDKLTDTEPFYIREMAKVRVDGYDFVDMHEKAKDFDDESDYVNGKQYFVRLNNTIEPEDGYDTFKGELEFVTVELPYAESVYTTIELHDTGLDTMAEKYGSVDNIDDEKVKYRFTESNFTVYNAGNVTVEPESMELVIQINNASTSDKLSLKNITTGEEFRLTKSLSERHISLRGMNILDGTVNAFRDSNRRLVSLVPGDNQFEITGATFSEVWFRFKYYYK